MDGTAGARGPAERLALDVAEINDHLAGGGTPEDAVRRLVALAAASVPGCRWAGLTTWSPDGRPQVLGASAEEAVTAERLQRTTGEGPGRQAVASGGAVHAPDLAAAGRWPAFTASALARTSVRGVLALPVGGTSGQTVLALWGDRAGTPGDDALAAGALLVAHARVLVAHARAVDRAAALTRALGTSRQIGAAVGVLMHARKVTAEEAFGMLVTSSQHLNRALRLVAEDVTATGTLPPP